MKKLFYASTITAFLATGFGILNAPNHPSGLPLRYHNSQYNFTFFLPASWQGYSVVAQQWEGGSYSPAKDTTATTAHGPIIVLRHPQWKASDPYQDIPIMVFTRTQWAAEQQQEFFPYACGLIDEMWHNRKYVFGIYNRYEDLDIQSNGGVEVKGAEEAADIIKRNCSANDMPHLRPRPASRPATLPILAHSNTTLGTSSLTVEFAPCTLRHGPQPSIKPVS